MTYIGIVRMTLTNFKGIRSLEMNFDPEVTSDLEKRTTGKNTLMDAFLWTLLMQKEKLFLNWNMKSP